MHSVFGAHIQFNPMVPPNLKSLYLPGSPALRPTPTPTPRRALGLSAGARQTMPPTHTATVYSQSNLQMLGLIISH